METSYIEINGGHEHCFPGLRTSKEWLTLTPSPIVLR